MFSICCEVTNVAISIEGSCLLLLCYQVCPHRAVVVVGQSGIGYLFCGKC